MTVVVVLLLLLLLVLVCRLSGPGFYGGLRPMFLQYPKRFVLENDPPFNHVSVPRYPAKGANFGGKGRSMPRISNEQAAQVARSVVAGAARVLLDAPTHSLKAVELANMLRNRIGKASLVTVRERCGGLLVLLERHPRLFRVDRIPKNDCVSLVPQSAPAALAILESIKAAGKEPGVSLLRVLVHCIVLRWLWRVTSIRGPFPFLLCRARRFVWFRFVSLPFLELTCAFVFDTVPCAHNATVSSVPSSKDGATRRTATPTTPLHNSAAASGMTSGSASTPSSAASSSHHGHFSRAASAPSVAAGGGGGGGGGVGSSVGASAAATGGATSHQQQEGMSDRCLHVGNVASNMTEANLRAKFGKFGPIEALKLVSSRKGRRFAFVTFEKPDDAEHARASLTKQHIWRSNISFAKVCVCVCVCVCVRACVHVCIVSVVVPVFVVFVCSSCECVFACLGVACMLGCGVGEPCLACRGVLYAAHGWASCVCAWGSERQWHGHSTAT